MTFHGKRRDEFGAEHRYIFAFSGEQKLSRTELNGVRHIATKEGASLVIIGDADRTGEPTCIFSPQDFVARLGGAVYSFLPLESEYPPQLATLGRNELPPGVTGKADDLFEVFVHAGLEFLLQEKVVRYGQDRLFETIPDGLVLGRRSVLVLYDCKAARNGYDISRDSIRQFADYVKSFHARYEQYVGRLHAFLVISGFFQSPDTLQARSDELYAECQVRLVFLSADEMGEIVAMLAAHPAYRRSLDWRSIFSATVIKANKVNENLQARLRDKVIS
jgi:hypothetical protein